MKPIHGLKLYLAIISILGQASYAEIVSRTKTIIHKGKIRFHYDNVTTTTSASSCETVILIGVGTAMGVGDYDKLCHDLVTNTSIVIVMMDHNPQWMVKTDAQKYSELSATIVHDIATLVPVCNNNRSPPPRNGFIIGGHSASGQAAIDALHHGLFHDAFEPIGLFGLDPFDATVAASDFIIDIPAMLWGFTKTTCDVNIVKAAEYAYEHTSNSKRVFYQVDNANRSGITHCIFTDHGCGGGIICPTHSSNDWVRTVVGDTARRFVTAIESGNFSRSSFVLNDAFYSNHHSNDNKDNTHTSTPSSIKNPIHLFVGRESPKHKPMDPIMIHAALS